MMSLNQVNMASQVNPIIIYLILMQPTNLICTWIKMEIRLVKIPEIRIFFQRRINK